MLLQPQLPQQQLQPLLRMPITPQENLRPLVFSQGMPSTPVTSQILPRCVSDVFSYTLNVVLTYFFAFRQIPVSPSRLLIPQQIPYTRFTSTPTPLIQSPFLSTPALPTLSVPQLPKPFALQPTLLPPRLQLQPLIQQLLLQQQFYRHPQQLQLFQQLFRPLLFDSTKLFELLVMRIESEQPSTTSFDPRRGSWMSPQDQLHVLNYQLRSLNVANPYVEVSGFLAYLY